MPYKYIGRVTDYKGKTLWEILGNLKNNGVGRIVARSKFECYYKILKVETLANPQEPSVDSLRKVRALVEKTFRGKTFPKPVLLESSTYKTDYKLIPKDEEEKYCKKPVSSVAEHILPRTMEFPPLLKELLIREAEARGQKIEEPKLEVAYNRRSIKTSYRVAKEGETPTVEIAVGLGKPVSPNLYDYAPYFKLRMEESVKGSVASQSSYSIQKQENEHFTEADKIIWAEICSDYENNIAKIEDPRPFFPFHRIWSRETAAKQIQAYMRAYWDRKKPDIQEVRGFWKIPEMHFSALLAAVLLVQCTNAQENGWSWNNNQKSESNSAPSNAQTSENQQFDLFEAMPSDHLETAVQLNSTEAEKVVDEILTSTREGRALDGLDELYTDPNVQEALQNGDDGQARNVIKDRLCYLGLVQCDGGEQIEGKRPFIGPEELVYAQPVAINPVGRPIPTIPIKGVLGGYGPAKPVHIPGPPGKYGPPPPNKFVPPPPPGYPGKPPRRHYGPPPSKPFYGKPGLSGEIYEGEYLSKPPASFGGFSATSESPYQFVTASNKDKRVEITVNAQGGAVTAPGGAPSANGAVEHVHHHFHHNVDGKPTVGVNQIPIASAAVTAGLTSLGSPTTFGKPVSSGFSPLVPETIIAPISGSFGGSYGGQHIANYGSSLGVNSFGAIKPVTENFDSFGTSIGSYGSTSDLYKKELNLNPVNNNFIQSNYADKYQGLESSKYENFDCVCVPYNQCPTHDVIGRKDDLYLAIDPRNLKSDIEAEEERVITDENGNMTVVRIAKGASLNATEETDKKNEEPKKISKREAPAEKKSGEEEDKPEGRQFYGGNGFNSGRPQTCGPRHVCCKRPTRPAVPQVNRQCGTRHSQGINGRIKNPVYIDGDSEFGEYPWQVAILKKDPKESVYVCGGTLIDSLHIITAAHCVKTYHGFDLRVRLGEWDVNHDVEFFPYIEREVTSVHVHPEFYAGTLYNDIAVLRIDKPVDFAKNPHISPACLPHPRDDYTGTRCWTTGWGKDAFGDFGKYQNILKEVDVPVLNDGVCQRQMQQTRLGYDFKLHPGFICAGGEEGKDACKGDGGGPMVCERGGTWQVVGIVSWGIGCGQVGVPGVYVKVAHYLDWIKQITQIY
nr:unnamed protein product [Callosobruchus chinensis]